MDDYRDALEAHLKGFRSAPFLFVGAGVSKRYLGLDGWQSLLERMAALVENDFAYYTASADGRFQEIASLIARDLHDPWWKEARFAASRKRFDGKLAHSESALKAEVSIYVADATASAPTDGRLAVELDLLRKVVVDGVVTTNYDSLLESIFPEYRVFVGQEELLFHDPQGVGEIYKIHGSHEAPDSLIITEADYARFNARN